MIMRHIVGIYRQDLQRIEGLAQFGFWDFRGTHDGNVWLCDGHLKVIDQDPPWNHIPHGRKEFAALAKGQFIRLSGFVEGLVRQQRETTRAHL